MAISLEGFKIFASISRPPQPGETATGIIVITRKDPSSQSIISFPKNTLFRTTSGIAFVNSDPLEINESRVFIETAVLAVSVGVAGNVPANTQWESPVNTDILKTFSEVVITNPSAFVGGVDPVSQKVYPAQKMVEWKNPDDSLLQSNLDLATKNVLTKLGNPPQLPDEPAVDRSVYLFAQFYTENRITQEMKISFGGGENIFGVKKTEYYRERVFNAINREIDNLLRPFVDVAIFMPEVAS